jgi:hypothetical protein
MTQFLDVNSALSLCCILKCWKLTKISYFHGDPHQPSIHRHDGPSFPLKNGHLWHHWGMFLMTITGKLPGLFIWTILYSNIAGRTKKFVTSAVLFIAYCTGNTIGAQVFMALRLC